jgi:hypothetical protein
LVLERLVLALASESRSPVTSFADHQYAMDL